MASARLLIFAGLLLALGPWDAEPADAADRNIPTRIASFDEAPVIVQTARGEIVSSYERPDDVLLRNAVKGAAARVPQHVRYMNRLNEEVKTMQLRGALTLKNTSNKTAEVIRVKTILLNAFRERIGSEEDLVEGPLGPFRTKQVEWSRPVSSEDVYELYVVVTKIRFIGGEVWAPREELVFSP